MSPGELDARMRFAAQLARAAGALGQRYFLRELDYAAEAKGAQDWVSAADRAVEAHIRDALARAFPGDAMLGEETGGALADRTWVVDPIDGTLNFVHGVRYWCTSIAVIVEGRRAIGAIFDPSLDELFLAARGRGATCNGMPIAVSGTTALDHALLAMGYVHRHDLAAHHRLRQLALRGGAAVKDMGAGALMLAHVAAGRYDGFLEPHMHPWDALAGLLLVEEAGGIVMPYPGPQGLAGGGEVLAATPGLYERLRSLAAQARSPETTA
jgi:myo-inositol-1(or 4)-monophosphatase